MIRIVRPTITSKVGLSIELSHLIAFRVIPMPTLMPPSRSFVNVDKPIGFGKANQKTDVLLIRFMLNLIAAKNEEFRTRFGQKPLPHEPLFDKELERRIRIYQQAGGLEFKFQLKDDPLVLAKNRDNGQDLPDLPPLPKPPSNLLVIREPLFVDGIIDPCRPEIDRGSRSNLVYTMVHLNYHVLKAFGDLDARIAPVLIKQIDTLMDRKLDQLREELDKADRLDPSRPNPRPPIPKPVPIPPSPVPDVVI